MTFCFASFLKMRPFLTLFVRNDFVWCYDQLCCPVNPKLLLGLHLGVGCDKKLNVTVDDYISGGQEAIPHEFPWMVYIKDGCKYPGKEDKIDIISISAA